MPSFQQHIRIIHYNLAWKIFCSIRSSKLSDMAPTNIPCVRFEILFAGIKLSIYVEIDLDLSWRFIVIDCRFCNTFPKGSDKVLVVSPTTCPEKIFLTVFITTFVSLFL